jgi:hypothetical protein
MWNGERSVPQSVRSRFEPKAYWYLCPVCHHFPLLYTVFAERRIRLLQPWWKRGLLNYLFTFRNAHTCLWAGVAQSVCLTKDWTTGVQTPTEGKDFSSSLCIQISSEAHPASCPVGTRGPTCHNERPSDQFHNGHGPSSVAKGAACTNHASPRRFGDKSKQLVETTKCHLVSKGMGGGRSPSLCAEISFQPAVFYFCLVVLWQSFRVHTGELE